MLTVPLSRGLVAVIDDEDADLVLRYKWHAAARGRTFYAQRNVLVDGRRTTQRMHSLITGWAMVDHIDGDGWNNRRVNMRPTTHAQNCYNQRKVLGTSSRYKGVSWHKNRNRWWAYIQVDGKRQSLGYFDSEIDAALAYDAAAPGTYGEFARLNYPRPSTSCTSPP